MSLWQWLVVSAAVPFVLAVLSEAWKSYERPELWAECERKMVEKGLPPATHRRRRAFRTLELASFDERGQLLWSARRWLELPPTGESAS